jgi:KAP family P-loop domain
MADDEDDTGGIWGDDLLDRERDARFLQTFLIRRLQERAREGRTQSYVLNLDARWGYGKTFFLTRLGQQLRAEGFPAVYVNAWADDHADDPMIAVMAAIDDELGPHLKQRGKLRKSWETVRRSGMEIATIAGAAAVKKGASALFGEAVDRIAEIFRDGVSASNSDDKPGAKVAEEVARAASQGVEKFIDRHTEEALARFKKGQSAIRNFREQLAKFIAEASAASEMKSPLFILVDELDRCRPTYAITLLERIKHLFDVDGVVFVIATDSTQLRHSIKAVYGETFESGRYLLRFFDRSYVFEEPTLDDFVAALFSNYVLDSAKLSSPPENDHEAFFKGAIRFFGLSLRDAEQCFDVLRTVITTWPYPSKLELVYLLPLIIAFQQADEELFRFLEQFSAREAIKAMKIPVGRGWTLPFFEREEFVRGKTVQVDFTSVFQDFLFSAQRPLSVIMEESPASGHERWVRDRFSAEWSAGSFDPRNSPVSIVRKYAEMVRNAGRFHAADR